MIRPRVAVTSARAAVAMSLALGLALVGPAHLAGATTPKPATLAQILGEVEDSVNQTQVPADLTPSLSQFAGAHGGRLAGPTYVAKCDAAYSSSRSEHPFACFMGNTKGTKTIALIGDSNVGNWAPGLDMGLRSTDYRLAVFPYSGCYLPAVTYTSSDGGTRWIQCNVWHHSVISAVKSLDPVAVIVVSGPRPTPISNSVWAAGMAAFFRQLAGPVGRIPRILIGTIPYLSEQPLECLAAYANPEACEFNYSTPSGDPTLNGTSSFYENVVARDALIVSAAHATYIDPKPWLCYDEVCSPVIGRYLAYADQDHLTVAFAQYLSGIITAAVLRVVDPKKTS